MLKVTVTLGPNTVAIDTDAPFPEVQDFVRHVIKNWFTAITADPATLQQLTTRLTHTSAALDAAVEGAPDAEPHA